MLKVDVKSTHLGNVLATVSDKKIQQCSSSVVSYYTADLLSAQDYSPFGAPLPGRSYDLLKEQSRSIIVNNTFASTVEGWAVSGSATVAVVSGQLKITYSAANAGAKQYAGTLSGKDYVYQLKVDFTGGTSPMMMVVKDNLSGTTLASLKVTTSGTYTLKFKAISGNTYVYAQCSTVYTAPAKFFYIDNVIVEEDKTLQPGYAFGFNGKFKDDETYGAGACYDYGFRIYNPRLGRFLSVDPLSKNYPWYTPYQFSGNKPISNIDVDGLEDKPVNPNTPPSDPNLAALNLLVGQISPQLNKLWNNSNKVGADGRQVEEWGAAIFSQEVQTQSMSTGAIKVVNKIIVANAVSQGDPAHVEINFTPPTLGNVQLLGEAHTHAYAEGSMYEGMPPSFDDVQALKSHSSKQGYTLIVEAGNTRFALVITDPVKAQKFFEKSQSEMSKLYSEGEGEYKGSQKQEGVQSGLSKLLKDSGIKLYKTTDEAKKEFKPVEGKKEEEVKTQSED